MKNEWLLTLRQQLDAASRTCRDLLGATPEPVQEKFPTQFILTVWRKSLLSEGWQDMLGPMDVVSFKIADGDKYFQVDEAEELIGLLPSNVGVHGWGFHYCLTELQAEKEAENAATVAQRIGATGYHWNAEKHWAGGSDPSGAAIVFAKRFKALAPDIDLYANCFNKKTTSDMMAWFDYFEPMCYGTKPRTISKKIGARMTRKDIPPTKRCVMTGTGRMAGAKRAWGYLESSGGHGLVDLVAKYAPHSVNFFRAGMADGEDIMAGPNAVNPALGEQVKALRQALSDVARESV